MRILAKLYRMTVAEATAMFLRRFQPLSEDQIRRRLVIITRDGVRIRPATRAD